MEGLNAKVENVDPKIETLKMGIGTEETGPRQGELSCHGPLPVIAIGKRELTFEPHSTQDLRALNDAELLWDLRDPPSGASAPLTTPLGNANPPALRNPDLHVTQIGSRDLRATDALTRTPQALGPDRLTRTGPASIEGSSRPRPHPPGCERSLDRAPRPKAAKLRDGGKDRASGGREKWGRESLCSIA